MWGNTDKMSSVRERELATALEITPLFYTAALRSNLWPEVLEKLAAAMDAIAAQISIADTRSGIQAIASAQHGVPHHIYERWLSIEDHISYDPRAAAALNLPNRPLREIDLISLEDWHASPMYREIFAPGGIGCSMGYMAQLETENLMGVLGVFTADGDPPFSDALVERFGLYVPHFRQAIALAGVYYQQSEYVSAIGAIFDRLRSPIFVTDRFGGHQYCNSAGRRLIESDGGMTMTDGKLQTHDPETTKSLQSKIWEAATAGSESVDNARENLLLIRRRDDERPLMATISAIGNDHQSANPLAKMLAVVIVIDPKQKIETNPETLQRLYGLTAREAELMTHIGTNSSLRSLANKLGITYETAKTHLKRIYSKTGVSSQAELARLCVASFAE